MLVVGHDGTVIYRKAYGLRALEPRREVMSLDTAFDPGLAYQSDCYFYGGDATCGAGRGAAE